MDITKSQNTYSEYIARINRVIDYISKNLDRQIGVLELAKVACFSEYHFHRIFGLIVGESINGYVRRMRLERAAMTLSINANRSITEVALDLGFSSSANFSKAFKAHFGYSPSDVRKITAKNQSENSRNGKTDSRDGKVKHNLIREYDFGLDQLPDVHALGIAIKSLPPLHVAYVRTLKGYAEEPIRMAWDKLMKWAGARGLFHDGTIALGIEHDDPILSGFENCRYDACLSVPETIRDFQGEIGIQDLSGGIYAVHIFTATESMWDGMMRGYQEIFTWIAVNGLSPSNNPCYTLYLNALEMKAGAPAELAICVKVESLYSS